MGCELDSNLELSVVLHPGGQCIWCAAGGRYDDDLSNYYEAALTFDRNVLYLPMLLGLLCGDHNNIFTHNIELRHYNM